jgi:hypothetical protein
MLFYYHFFTVFLASNQFASPNNRFAIPLDVGDVYLSAPTYIYRLVKSAHWWTTPSQEREAAAVMDNAALTSTRPLGSDYKDICNPQKSDIWTSKQMKKSVREDGNKRLYNSEAKAEVVR